MSENALCKLIDELRKNGVIAEISQVTMEKPEAVIKELRTIIELDFSLHDKVFEDKIARLEKEAAEWRAEAKEIKKNSDEQLKSFRKGIEPYVDLLHMHETIAELKQRIAELESKETENVNEIPDSITIDGYKCKIIKAESGLYISRDEIYSIIDKEKEPLKQKCKELEDKHQSDCIKINRLNTTIDVLIHKVEYLRQFAGFE